RADMRHLLVDMAKDQRLIWTSPWHLRSQDSAWLAPVAGTAALMIASDTAAQRRASNREIAPEVDRLSNAGVAAALGTASTLYFLGRYTKNNHASQTGLLMGNAMASSALTSQGLKFIFGRQRPLESDHKGQFFQGGSSFPSQHAALAWSAASVISEEYP